MAIDDVYIRYGCGDGTDDGHDMIKYIRKKLDGETHGKPIGLDICDFADGINDQVIASLVNPELAFFPIISLGIFDYVDAHEAMRRLPDDTWRRILGHLPLLKTLFIKIGGDSYTRFFGGSPSSPPFSHLSNLKSLHLSLSSCELPSFPPLPPSLEELDIKATIAVADPSHLTTCPRLRSLSLYSTTIHRWEPTSRFDLPCLETLSCNEVRGAPLPLVSILHGCPALQVLKLVSCGVVEVPKEIGLVKNLQELQIPRLASRSLPEEICQLKDLRRLILYGSQLRCLPQGIGRLAKLEQLVVHSCKLPFLPTGLGHIASLKELEVQGNPLSGIYLGGGDVLSVMRDLSRQLSADAQRPHTTGGRMWHSDLRSGGGGGEALAANDRPRLGSLEGRRVQDDGSTGGGAARMRRPEEKRHSRQQKVVDGGGGGVSRTPIPPCAEPPNHLCCPISFELMTNPVITPLGHTYDFSNIMREIERIGRDPLTNEPLTAQDLRPNRIVQHMVEEWKKEHGEEEKEKEGHARRKR